MLELDNVEHFRSAKGLRTKAPTRRNRYVTLGVQADQAFTNRRRATSQGIGKHANHKGFAGTKPVIDKHPLQSLIQLSVEGIRFAAHHIVIPEPGFRSPDENAL